MKLKVNREHFIEVNNIQKFVIKSDVVLVYKKIGYPKILKSYDSMHLLKIRLGNLGHSIKEFQIEDKGSK